MNIGLISDYKKEDFISYGRPNYWDTPTGIYTALLKNPRVDKVKWYPYVGIDNPHFPYLSILNDIEDGVFEPDIIFYLACGPQIDEYFNHKYFKNVKLVVDLGDEPQTLKFNANRAYNADLVLTPDYECYISYKKKGYNVIHTGHFADMEVFKPNKNKIIKYDVVSTMNGTREGYIEFLNKKLNKSFVNLNGITGQQNAELFQSSKIIFQKSRFNEITRRIFEGMATKKLVITDMLPNNKKLDLFFRDGEEIILYKNKKDALRKIKYFLNNPKEREEIAEKGYLKVKNYYSATNIVNYIL